MVCQDLIAICIQSLLYPEQFVGLQGERPLGVLQDVVNRVAKDDAVVHLVARVERLQVEPHPRPLSEESGDHIFRVSAVAHEKNFSSSI